MMISEGGFAASPSSCSRDLTRSITRPDVVAALLIFAAKNISSTSVAILLFSSFIMNILAESI